LRKPGNRFDRTALAKIAAWFKACYLEKSLSDPTIYFLDGLGLLFIELTEHQEGCADTHVSNTGWR
jgi:hypothetical protein